MHPVSLQLKATETLLTQSGLTARWWIVLVASWLCSSLGSSHAQAAGCHATGQTTVMSTLAVDASLLGKWQYVGGQVYYVFHPQPAPCDGPHCQSSPDPTFQMNFIPPSNERSVSPANQSPVSIKACGPSWYCATSDASFYLSQCQCGLLRPPC
ncbi:MAG: hypothetical protein IT423_12680 [Pirellulaceae bacterium]|nr:hypothetical protein [Pirellulaceae bacterium]